MNLKHLKKKRAKIENSLINIKESDFIDFFQKRIQKEYIYYLFSLKKIPSIKLKRKDYLNYLNTLSGDFKISIELTFSYISCDFQHPPLPTIIKKGVFLNKLKISINEEKCTGTFFNALPKEIEHKTKNNVYYKIKN